MYMPLNYFQFGLAAYTLLATFVFASRVSGAAIQYLYQHRSGLLRLCRLAMTEIIVTSEHY
jgi:hypothetical protein